MTHTDSSRKGNMAHDHSFFNFLQPYRTVQGVQWGEGVSSGTLESVVARLGELPADYKFFLRHYGWLEMWGDYVFGLGPGVPPWAHVIQATDDERDMENPLPDSHVAIYNDGAGNISCLSALEASIDQKSRVYVWLHEASELALEPDNFEALAEGQD